MEKGPSITAQIAAMHRYLHQILDEPRVFDDHLAFGIIGAQNRAALQTAQQRFADIQRSDFLRAFVVARSCYTEDGLREAVRTGLRQYVILGAGLDTFAYRNPYTHDEFRVFEVDHPATQGWKQALLAENGISIPPSLTFVPIDFETQTLTDRLQQAYFDFDEPAFFSWLGVTPYLTKGSIDSTLKFIAALKKGSGVVFDYVISPSLLNEQQRLQFDTLSSRVAMAGEPWQTFFDPSLLKADLVSLGFEQTEDLGTDEINARYFAGRKDNLKIRGFGRIMKAIV